MASTVFAVLSSVLGYVVTVWNMRVTGNKEPGGRWYKLVTVLRPADLAATLQL
jgi:hypothetical protein